MKLDGSITGYLNKGVGNMLWQGQIKHAEGRERKDLRLADMDGDGKDDLVWLDNKSGRLTYWKNMGPSSSPIPATNPDSAFGWLDKGLGAVGGGTRGEAIELANMNGLGRADYISKNLDYIKSLGTFADIYNSRHRSSTELRLGSIVSTFYLSEN